MHHRVSPASVNVDFAVAPPRLPSRMSDVSCGPLAPLGEGTFAKIFREKDPMVKELDQFLYTDLGVDLSFHVSEGLRRRGEEVLEVLNVSDFEGAAKAVNPRP